MAETYKIATPTKRVPGIARLAIVREHDHSIVRIWYLRGDPLALIPAFGSAGFQTERDAMEHCLKEHGVALDAWVERSGDGFSDPGHAPARKRKTKEANAPLSDATAETLCRTPRVSVAEMHQIFEWATAQPSPAKIQTLLILQTQNWASMSGLDQPFHDALAACARMEASPLWHTIEHDWEHCRLWHAVRALVALEQPELLQQLIKMGDQPLERIAWREIKEAADRRGMPIPDHIAAIQHALEAVPAGVLQWFHRRRSAWPAHLEPDPRLQRTKRPALRAPVDDAAADRANRLVGTLQQLEMAIREKSQEVQDWIAQPGADEDALAMLASEAFGGGPLPQELRVFFGWHLASEAPPAGLHTPDGFCPLPIPEALETWRQTADMRASGMVPGMYRKTCFPLFADGMGGLLVWETLRRKAGELLEFRHDEPGSKRRFRGLHEWAQNMLDHVRQTTRPAKKDRPAETDQPQTAGSPTDRYELDLSSIQFGACDVSLSDEQLRVIAPGTVFVRPIPGEFVMAKLAANCWCFAAAAPKHIDELLDAVRVLVRDVAPVAWSVDDKTAGEVLRWGPSGPSLKVGHAVLRIIRTDGARSQPS